MTESQQTEARAENVAQCNQAELLQEYRKAYARLKPKTLQTILELRARFEAKGMRI